MGYYAAPVFNSVDATLSSGYAPPAGINATTQLSSLSDSGVFAYKVPSYGSVDATLLSGYSAPSGVGAATIVVVLSKPLAGSAQSILTTGLDFALVPTPAIRKQFELLAPSSIFPGGFGTHSAKNTREIISVGPLGWQSTQVLVGYGVPNPRTYFSALRTYGDFSIYGIPDIGYRVRSIYPGHISSQLAFGVPSLQNLNVGIAPTGFSSSIVGTHTVSDRGIRPVGIAPTSAVGTPFIAYRIRYLTPGGIAPVGFGATVIQNWIRYLTMSGADQSAYGTAVLTRGVRTVAPTGFVATTFGTAGIDNKTRYYNLIGWSSSTISAGHRIWDGKQYATNVTLGDGMFVPGPIVSFPALPPDDTQTIELSGQGMPIPDNQVWPLHKIENRNKQAFPEGFTSYGLGAPRVDQTIYLTIRPLGADWSVFGTAFVDQTIKKVFPEGFTDEFVPASHQIYNFRIDVVAGGLNSYVSGAHAVARGTARPIVPGIAPTSVVPTGLRVEYRIRALVPTGFSATLWGTATLQNKNIWAYPGGIAPPSQTAPSNGDRQIPNPWISYRVRSLTGAGNINTHTVPNTHIVTPWIQYVDLAARGITPDLVGTGGNIQFRHREIFPTFILGPYWGVTAVKRRIFVEPAGWDSSFVSYNAELLINTRRVYHYTGEADQAEYGVAEIFNWRQDVNLHNQGWYDTQWNFPVVYNLKREIAVGPYMDTNSDPTQWPPYSPSVENKARTLGPGGWQSSRFSVIGNIVKNAATPLLPPGLDAALWGPETFIAHHIRYVGPEGWDSFYNTQYTVIYNNAAVPAPQGWDSAVVGTPEQVINLNRTVKHTFPYGGETVGTAFIAYRVRTVYPSLFYDVPSGFPEVRFNPYPIAPAGIAPLRVGGHTVYERFTIAYPKSANVHSVPWVGEPVIKNRNKTLMVFPSDQSLYGLAKVFNYNTHLTITAGDLTVWGSHLISYRTRTITGAPISVPVFSVTHRIWNVLPDPPATRRIEPNGLYIGLEYNPGIVSSPVIRLATIYPEGIDREGFGQPILTRNTLEVPPGPFNLDQVGTPTLIFTRYLLPLSVPGSGESSSDQNWGKPRVTPHTIYAPSADQATQQARDNHLGNPPHCIDNNMGDGQWFGRPNVSNQHRVLGPVPSHDYPGLSPTVRFGSQTFTLRRQYVYPTPIRSLRFGLIMFLDVPQYVSLDSLHNGISPLNDFGQHTVAPPPVVVAPEVKPSGFVATLWGTHRVELSIRTVSPQGTPHRGNPEQGLTNPWGTPLVGFPRVYQWGGYVLTLWGNAWVSHKNRELPVEGWNSLSLEDDDLGSFADRMRVRLRNPSDGVVGIGPDSVVGDHVVTHSVRTILGRGISGYNSGDHIVKTASVILLAGWDSLEVGDIDRWEAGKVKPHGDDLSITGIPRILTPLRPSGPADDAVGVPRIGVPLYLLGLPEIGFAGPSVSNPFGCTNRVVTPLPILSQQNVPQPVVT